MKILVPLDGSSKSESILPLVALLAERWQAEVIALRALDPSTGGADPIVVTLSESAYQQMLESGRAYLEDVAKRHPEIPMRSIHQVGSPEFCIEDVARKERANLIVMATHGHTGFVRWLWGSVAEGVARHAPCPALLVHSPETPVLFREILVPTDGSPPSLEVAHHIGMFLGPETKVTLLHCTGISHEEKADNLEVRADQAQLDKELRRHVDGRPWMRLEYVETPAPQGIFDWISEHDCDLIAMSTHGRDGLAHLWTGSIMEKVSRESKCPVLVFSRDMLKPESQAEVTHANL